MRKNVYLLTGFLGSGKTSLLMELLSFFSSGKVAVVVNEFGKIGVDGAIISKSGFDVTEIDNGSIFCACQLPRFEKALDYLVSLNVEAIFVEASGLSDPTHVKRIVEQKNFSSQLKYSGAICLIDAKRFHKYISTALVSEKQVLVSDIFIINKADLVDDVELANVVELLLKIRPDADYRITSFGRIDAAILETLNSKYNDVSADTPPPGDVSDIFIGATKDLSLRRLLLKVDSTVNSTDLHSFISAFAESSFRIKGFLELSDGLFLLNAVGELIDFKAIDSEPELADGQNHLVVLYNSKLPCRKAVEAALKTHPLLQIKIES